MNSVNSSDKKSGLFSGIFKNKKNTNITIEGFFGSPAFTALELSKQKMIRGVIELSSRNVRDIMIPRVDVAAISSNIAMDQLLKLIDSEGFSRIPVYNDTIDNIIGVLYVKDLLEFIPEKPKKIPIKKIIRKPFFIPETMPLDHLLVEFKKKKLHLAIVVDEYGGFAGIVTLEDILEEIVGDIEDEFDESMPDAVKLSKNSYEIDPRMTIEDVNEMININLPLDEFETIGGFVYDLFGEVPKKDETISYENILFKIGTIKGARINKIVLTIQNKNEKQ